MQFLADLSPFFFLRINNRLGYQFMFIEFLLKKLLLELLFLCYILHGSNYPGNFPLLIVDKKSTIVYKHILAVSMQIEVFIFPMLMIRR